jgi:hypothetical protein
MKVVTPGRKYTLEGKGIFANTSQDLVFVMRDKEGVLQPGITNEEVVAALVDRLYHQQGVRYSENTMEAISLLKQVKKLLTPGVKKASNGLKNFNKEEF